MRDEGVIKFNCNWKKTGPVLVGLDEIMSVRQKLFRLGLIGVYPDGIGYGNLSILEADKTSFIISGSQTGHLEIVTTEHFARVTNAAVENNRVDCEGPVQASSESLTHAMIYGIFKDCHAVIHVHSNKLWKKLLNGVPTTSADIPYGTPQMANEIKRLKEALDREKILVMAGHEDGVITFGANLDQAFQTLNAHFT